jgi:nucleoside-diphosphate-sugar epimerase
MGKEFEQPTFQINSEAAIDLAKKAKKMGVKKYLYASSCSVYGAGGDLPKTEYDDLNPQTAYAISKISAENGLKELSSKDFKVICFRFATACGYSSRLRLDLVLNDFVSSAVMNGKIEILSDGSPLRPLIDVKDMSRAFEWGIVENVVEDFLVLNTGSNEWNFNVKELAFLVSKHFQKSIEIKINDKAAPDKRSYKVDFSKFKALAPNHYPQCCIESTVDDLIIGVNQNHNRFTDFRDGYLIRLNALRYLMLNKKINNNLEII